MKRSFVILAIITFLAVIAAWISVSQRSPETKVAKAPLFPVLASKINEVKRIEITDSEESIVLLAKDAKWLLDSHGGYPTYFNRIKPLVIGISELEIREAKTANPAMFSRLEVEDISEENAKSTQIELQDEKGGVIASLIIGKDRVNRTDGAVDSFYVRRPGEEQSYLVKGQVNISASPSEWWDNELMNLSAERLHKISIQHSGATDQTVQASRKDKDAENYKLENIPEGFKAQSQTVIDSLARVVEDIHFDSVTSSADFVWPDEITTSEYQTFDGMIIKIKSAKVKSDTWSEFSFDYSGTAQNDKSEKAEKISVEEEVKLLNEKVKGWVYVVPPFKAKMLMRLQQDLIIAVEPERTPENGPEGGLNSLNNLDKEMPDTSSFKDVLPMMKDFQAP